MNPFIAAAGFVLVLSAPAAAYCAGYGTASGASLWIGQPDEDKATFTAKGGPPIVCALGQDSEADPTIQTIDCGAGIERVVFSAPAAIDHGVAVFRGDTFACPIPSNG